MQPATLKRGRGFSAGRSVGYAILCSGRPALCMAVLVFGWLFSGWPETWREVLRPPSVREADAAAPAGQWWSMSYPFREKITVTAGTAAPASGYSVAVTFGHATLVTAGKSLPSGDDLRVVYWNGSTWVELDRLLDEASSWNNASTKVWFKTQAAIGASTSDDNYYLYYGKASAGAPPANGMNVYLFYDDFSGTTIDTSKWTVTRGTTSVSGGILTVNPASSIWAQPTYAFGTDTRWEASIQLGGDGAELSFNFHAARDLDTNPWTGNWIILWSDATSHYAENSKASTLTDSAGFTDTTPTLFHTYVMNREGTTGVRYFQDATQRALLTTNVPTVSLRPYAFADAGTGATMWQKYDWWKVRQYVTPEPTSAIAAEEGVGPAYQAAGTIQFNTSTTLSVPWPAHAINDIGLLIIETQNQAVTLGTNAANWTPVTNSPQGTGTTSTGTKLTVFWSRATSTSMRNAGRTGTGMDHQIAQILTFRGVTTSGNPWDVTAGDVTPSTTTAVSIPGATTTVQDTLVVAIVSNGSDLSAPQIPGSFTNSDLSSVTKRQDNQTTASGGGGFAVATGSKALAGAYGPTSATLGFSSLQGRMSIALRPPFTTTIADGTNPGNTTIAPGAAATDVDAFTLQTSSGTDTVTQATVTLAGCSAPGCYEGITKVEITGSDAGPTVYGTVNNPSSDTVTFAAMSIPVSITCALPCPYKIRITPMSHANMPAHPCKTYAVTAKITSFTSSNLQSGTDTASATVTIDNQSPGVVTGASATPGSGQVTVSWTNPGDGDFSNVIVLRNTATITDVPAEGTAPAVNATVGTSVVRYISNGTSFIDTSLAGGTYYYKIFAKDSNGNYSATGVQVFATVSVLAPTAGEVSSSQTGGTSTTTWAHTTSGTNRVLVVGVSWANITTRTVTSVTYAGQTMTSAGAAVNAGNAGAEIFYLVAPATGSNTVAVTLSGSANSLVGGAVTLTGVNQTTPLGIFASATGSSTTPSVTVTSNTGETVIDTVSLTSSGAMTVSGGQTQQWQAGTSGRGAGSTKPGASSPTMSWASGNFAWAIGAVGVKPVATCSSVSDATYVTAETQGTQATVYWGFTSSSNPVLILRKTAAFGSEAPSSGAFYNVNEAIGGATVVFKGTSGTDASFNDTGLATGTTYYYKVFPKTSTPCYAPGIAVSVSPVASAVWGYSTTSASMAPPVLDPWSNVVVTGSNDNNFHGMVESDGTLKFAPAATGGPIQGRPATVPAGYRRPSTTANIAYITSQDGYVYAVNTSDGTQVWQSPP